MAEASNSGHQTRLGNVHIEVSLGYSVQFALKMLTGIRRACVLYVDLVNVYYAHRSNQSKSVCAMLLLLVSHHKVTYHMFMTHIKTNYAQPFITVKTS